MPEKFLQGYGYGGGGGGYIYMGNLRNEKEKKKKGGKSVCIYLLLRMEQLEMV